MVYSPTRSNAQNFKSENRVHLRAFQRLQRIDEEIKVNAYPNSKKLALLLEVDERTVKRDLAAMRERFGAPLKFERKRNGYRYLEPGWSLSLERFGEGAPSRSLWQALLIEDAPGFATAIGVHPVIGYNNLFHLAPAFLRRDDIRNRFDINPQINVFERRNRDGFDSAFGRRV